MLTIIDIFLTFITLLIIIRLYFNYCYQYWSKLNVPYLPPKFPLGNTNIYIPRGFSIGIVSKTYYNEFKKINKKFGGIYLITEPNLIIIDPLLICNILIKDFHHFIDRGVYHNENKDPLSQHIFAIDGHKWKQLRIKLTPTFTSGKMKMMFYHLRECSENMVEILKKLPNEHVEIKEILGRFTTDVIGTCAFGIDCNSLQNPNAEFRQMGLKIFEYSLLRSIKAFFILNLPKFCLNLGLTTNSKQIIDFFTNLVKETVEYRRRFDVKRIDFLQLLIDLCDHPDYRLTLNEISAQVFLFFIAGFETSSTTMTFALYELARNPEIQTRLRREIDEILKKTNGEITYDNLKEMKYLAQVVDETLRKYPVVPTLTRRCTIDYNLHGTNITIKKGTPILISILGLHYDEEYYPKPHIFNPERFNDDNKKLLVPYTYLPFGDGPRNCIGLRFGLMQTRLGIVQILKNFKISLDENIDNNIELDPYAFLLTTKQKIYLKIERI